MGIPLSSLKTYAINICAPVLASCGLTDSGLTAIRTPQNPCCKEIGTISLGIVPTQLSVISGCSKNHLPAVCSMETVN